MASLLSIPEELQDDIIELVLLDERKPPRDIETAAPGRAATQRSRNDGILSWEYGPSEVRFETESLPPASNALLLVNKSFHRQTKQALSRLFPDGINYKLDAMFVNEAELWPTWLTVPAPSNQVNTIDVTVRIFGRKLAGTRSAFVIGDGSPEQYVWLFYWLLEHFLCCGAASPPHLGWRQNITVKTINLNFTSGEPGLEPEDSKDQYSKWLSCHDLFPRRHSPIPDTLSDPELLAAGEPARMHPKWLADKLSGHLGGLLYMGYHAAAYGAILHERIGAVSIACNGSPLREILPGKTLASLDVRPDSGSECYTTYSFGHKDSHCRLLTFWNWKFATVRRRQAIGLPVAEPVVWPEVEDLRRWRTARDADPGSGNFGTRTWKCGPERCMCCDRDLEEMLEARGES